MCEPHFAMTMNLNIQVNDHDGGIMAGYLSGMSKCKFVTKRVIKDEMEIVDLGWDLVFVPGMASAWGA